MLWPVLVDHYTFAGRESFYWRSGFHCRTGKHPGGLTNIVIGRLFPQKNQGRWHDTATHNNGVAALFGPAALLFSWLPVIGDLLCVVSGWLRFA
ncbi:inner membrane YqaA domain protein [Candidatus Erwinia dacicola]|uniref:Inner membrane YqaA domain protein n=1 Tax=Candidatus Erwinia dacicola TaxID=252393 RepID=A0A328TNK2_9GAMM|nr:inner membrane YqaA domain protein [Candidatus Erwinia dacicola]